jgi:hypothetical protein
VEQNRNRSSVRVTESVALEILGRFEHGERPISISRRLGIPQTTVLRAIHRETWPEL